MDSLSQSSLLSRHHDISLGITTLRRSTRQTRIPALVREPSTLAPLSESNSTDLPILVPTRRPDPNDSSLQSTWSHRAWVACGCGSIAATLAKSAEAALYSNSWVELCLASVLGYVVADLATGVYHWAIDNYGDAKTPFFGSQIDAFQGHHKWPWTITRREFANNLHALARATIFFLVPLDLAPSQSGLHAFVGVCLGCLMFSQQFHAWAHTPKSRLPAPVAALQDVGVLVSRSMHSTHHKPPYDNNYCIVSGVWNEWLDESKVFEIMEMIIFFRFGVRPRCWSDPHSDWIADEDEEFVVV